MHKNKIEELVKTFEQKVKNEQNKVQKDLIEFEEPDVEVKFSLEDSYTIKLFIALARKHGFRPYRYPRQKRSTIMLKGKQSYIDQKLWPEFTVLSDELDFMLDQITNEVIITTLKQSDFTIWQKR